MVVWAERLLLLSLEIFSHQSLPLRNCFEAGPDIMQTGTRAQCHERGGDSASGRE